MFLGMRGELICTCKQIKMYSKEKTGIESGLDTV